MLSICTLAQFGLEWYVQYLKMIKQDMVTLHMSGYVKGTCYIFSCTDKVCEAAFSSDESPLVMTKGRIEKTEDITETARIVCYASTAPRDDEFYQAKTILAHIAIHFPTETTKQYSIAIYYLCILNIAIAMMSLLYIVVFYRSQAENKNHHKDDTPPRPLSPPPTTSAHIRTVDKNKSV